MIELTIKTETNWHKATHAGDFELYRNDDGFITGWSATPSANTPWSWPGTDHLDRLGIKPMVWTKLVETDSSLEADYVLLNSGGVVKLRRTAGLIVGWAADIPWPGVQVLLFLGIPLLKEV